MQEIRPASPEQLAEALRDQAAEGRRVELGGRFSKRAWGGRVQAPEARVSTAELSGLLQYEPADLTVGVASGTPWRELEAALASNDQFIPIDPPYAERATVGGVVATDSSGPRRRRYGTARDLVIGMQFATLEGKLVDSGGMVVKNVTGLDMAKPMIGSLGTLAAITRVNFKVHPRPESSATFVFAADGLDALMAARREMVGSQAQPAALDLLNRRSLAALDLGGDGGYALAAEALGSEAVVGRHRHEYEALARKHGVSLERYEGERGAGFWAAVRELAAVAVGGGRAWLRVSTVPARLNEALRLIDDSAFVLARAASGVVYVGVTLEELERQTQKLRTAGFATLLEQGPDEAKERVEAWAGTGSDFGVMKRLKEAFDPQGVLNPGRLWEKI